MKPLLRGSLINLLSSYLFIVVADVTCFITVKWGYQLMIICIESIIFVAVMILLQIADFCLMKKRIRQQGNIYLKISAKSFDIGNV